LVIVYWLLVSSYWLLAVDYWLLVIGHWSELHWLLVIGYWFGLRLGVQRQQRRLPGGSWLMFSVECLVVSVE